MALVTMISKYTADYSKLETTGPHTLFTGAVIRTLSRCEKIMSDVYADVSYAECWDAEQGKLVEWTLGNSEFGRHGNVISVEVDATPETLAAVEAWKAAEEIKRLAAVAAAKEAARLADLATPDKGKIVVVARGRKVAKGTVGEVFWVGVGRAFKPWLPAPVRCGIRVTNGQSPLHEETVWVEMKHLDVLAQSSEEYEATTGKAAA